MAYVVLYSLSKTINQILNHEEYPFSVNGKQYLVSLNEQVVLLLEFLREFPDDAEGLGRRMRDAANEAEDVIEHFMYEHIRSTTATDIEYDLVELKMAMAEIDSIARETTEIRRGNARPSDTPSKQSAPRSSPFPAPAVDAVTVGLENDLEAIKRMVCSDSRNLKTIPITGMGGLGKTTLADELYNDRAVMEEFPVRAWVTVSPYYKLENLFAGLLCSLRRVVGEGSDESNDPNEDKVHKICEILKARKYLIVLDDMWCRESWDEIGMTFPDSSNGSRIVITTRNDDVANHAKASLENYDPSHTMQPMDPKNSWRLLKQKVFPNRECPPELEKVGKDIANRCKGLPLAIVAIARFLSANNETPSSWEEVAENVRSVIQNDKGFQRSMSLSYTDLPLYARHCALYMGGFPEDYEIRVSKLLKLWVADEGFGVDEGEARAKLDEVVLRNLALVTAKKSNGKVKSCKLIHGFFRDFCTTMALDENFERRVSNAHPDLRCLAKGYASTLRSVICFQPTESSLLGLRKLRLLRALDVVDTHAYSLPPRVFDLFHLRYLAFSCRMEIPPAISRLQNLRTLIIRPSKRFRCHSKIEGYLPIEIWAMPLLEHLVSFFDLLPDPEGASSALVKLLTLSVTKLICTKDMMAMIPNVEKLGITYFGDIYQQDYELNNLVLLHRLEKLTLVFKADHPLRLTFNPVFPRKLKKLTLGGWKLSWNYMGVIGCSLPYLKVLKLRDHACEGGRWETNEDQFRRLKHLHIDSSNLEEWAIETSHFPRLKRLVIYRCPSLSKIPKDLKLELIQVDYANQSLVKCVKEIKEEQRCYENDFLQVRFMHYQVSQLSNSSSSSETSTNLA